MKIHKVTQYKIEFDNGKGITYADFQQIIENNSDILDYDFENNLIFEKCDNGLRFGDSKKMFFVPCYSGQNGFYSIDLDIYYDSHQVLNTDCDYK